ncbi:LysR family transcriptional regulator [Rubrivivax benzoatilyticus]|uniref:LysR family transcriptional regulator n=1 Tax=Rubrivivax benzoatilyticus TaxID=316997 RepID=A0ABX0I284_9BURK|nr:LysR family transcriptional regulator [Rubrivivax benzoatilyticus]EGJ11263.1 LysR family transcriptional regulator [Rubrivivax benzoatilyticus JA2 = ATCC BAA-35]NHK99729.1 LysR family transcriptional regulator [Rubrivivax benzoatilyticus]NHL25602.1 LysR family transcriptional regulator [Rubrivivax benzoatilyticus]
MTKPFAGADRLELLQTFVRIVDAGSLSAAAVALGTTQPTISRRLQQLERSLGLTLLQRSTHSMAPTEDGQRCYEHARSLLERWDAAEADLRGVQDVPRGRLRVVVPHAFGQQQLVVPLLDFLRRHPEVSVEWLLHDRLPDFIGQGVDCAIRVGAVDEPGLVAVRLAEVPRLVVAAPGLWGDGPPPAEPEALAALPWLAAGSFYRDEIELQDRRSSEWRRLAIQPRLTTDSLYALREAARGGAGAAIISSWLVAEDLAAGRLVHLAPDWRAAPLPVVLLHPPARLQPARLRAFIAAMRAAMPTLSGMVPATRASA